MDGTQDSRAYGGLAIRNVLSVYHGEAIAQFGHVMP
jgi:hypothetical protein